MAKFHGVGVNFGVSSSLAGVTGAFQTEDNTDASSNEKIMDGGGTFQNASYYGFFQEATFEYVATGAGPSGTIAVTKPAVGDILVVTNTTHTQIAGTNWIVENVDTKGSNTTAHRVTVKLWRADAITS